MQSQDEDGAIRAQGGFKLVLSDRSTGNHGPMNLELFLVLRQISNLHGTLTEGMQFNSFVSAPSKTF